jgi:xanthine dehydrogenase accessory factor
MSAHYQKLQELLAAGTPFVAVMLVESVASTPADAGAKMLVTTEGLAFGTVGGGRLEARAIEQAQSLLQPNAPKTLLVNWNLQTDIHMTCGGAVKLFFDAHHARPWDIVIFGAGHIAQALIPTLLNLDCRLTCLDTRADWLDKLPANSPKLTKHHATDLAAHVQTLPAGAFVLLMTQGHGTDLPILIETLRRHDLPYVGVIGSAAKRAALKKGVQAANIPEETFAKVHCPMGLDLGTNHPHEIAISIAAQLLQVRDRLASIPPVPGVPQPLRE